MQFYVPLWHLSSFPTNYGSSFVRKNWVVFTSGEAMLVYKSILLSNLLGAQAPVKSGEIGEEGEKL